MCEIWVRVLWHNSSTDFNPKPITTTQLLSKQASILLQDNINNAKSKQNNVCHMYSTRTYTRVPLYKTEIEMSGIGNL
jgi:hypothetical protein